MKTSKLLSCCMVAVSGFVYAEVSASVTLVSDYLLHGVSQTDSQPALQPSVDYRQSQWYAGSFASNVDYQGDETALKMDVYVGYRPQLNEITQLDMGVQHYTFHGDDLSEEANYTEAYTGLIWYQKTSVRVFVTDSYADTGANHITISLTHRVPVKNYDLLFAFNRLTSLSSNKFQWDDDNSYEHWMIGAEWQMYEIDTQFTVQGTTLNAEMVPVYESTADTSAVLRLAKRFEF